MKKFLSLALCGLLLFSCVGCSQSADVHSGLPTVEQLETLEGVAGRNMEVTLDAFGLTEEDIEQVTPEVPGAYLVKEPHEILGNEYQVNIDFALGADDGFLYFDYTYRPEEGEGFVEDVEVLFTEMKALYGEPDPENGFAEKTKWERFQSGKPGSWITSWNSRVDTEERDFHITLDVTSEDDVRSVIIAYDGTVAFQQYMIEQGKLDPDAPGVIDPG
ncbi:MAG: hypothetical protein ACOYJZ_11030 [Acutalibacter sp.]|jgi:hypothetical protein